MGCNCGNKATPPKYAYTDQNGKTTEYTSQIQAEAAKIRNKGLGSVRKIA